MELKLDAKTEGDAALPIKKRVFDLLFSVLTLPVWLPLLLVALLLVLVFSGTPLFYFSQRRIYRQQSARITKIRVMVRNAQAIANRQTIPVEKQRFLNIPLDSPVYTRIGRCIERYDLTELPQFFHVLSGKMSVIGSRPLPEDVIASLKEEFPAAEDRFLSRCGLTGPVQLVGRENISDRERLEAEIRYCRICITRYSFRLDFMIALYTALVLAKLKTPLSLEELHRLMDSWSSAPTAVARRAA
jgi:lipopolysaccharide/colanic/teichoic acid biosynthesis glycosyltransferase